jgi:hypothetical protein
MQDARKYPVGLNHAGNESPVADGVLPITASNDRRWYPASRSKKTLASSGPLALFLMSNTAATPAKMPARMLAALNPISATTSAPEAFVIPSPDTPAESPPRTLTAALTQSFTISRSNHPPTPVRSLRSDRTFSVRVVNRSPANLPSRDPLSEEFLDGKIAIHQAAE